jgi:hypothetical protein
LFEEKMKMEDGARKGGMIQSEKGLDGREKIMRERAEVTVNQQTFRNR